MYSKQLTCATTVLTDDKLKRILYNAMPVSWKNEFRKNHGDISNMTFVSLKDKMMMYEEIMAPPKNNNSNSSPPSQRLYRQSNKV
jgi:hypothetical protein